MLVTKVLKDWDRECGWCSEGELSDRYCGLRRPQECAVLFAWHPQETCYLPTVLDKRREPRPERKRIKITTYPTTVTTVTYSICNYLQS